MPWTIKPFNVLHEIWSMCNDPTTAYWFRLVETIKGGGGFENWALGTFFIYLWTHYGEFDWQREYPSARRRVDLAFNVHEEAYKQPDTPLILTEWKANCDYNTMATGLSADFNKLQEVIPALGKSKIYPCPYIFGIGPNQGGGFQGCNYFQIPNSGLYFYYSTAATWRSAPSTYQYTWYARNDTDSTASSDAVPALPSNPNGFRVPVPGLMGSGGSVAGDAGQGSAGHGLTVSR